MWKWYSSVDKWLYVCKPHHHTGSPTPTKRLTHAPQIQGHFPSPRRTTNECSHTVMGTPTHHHTKPHTENVSTHTYNTHKRTYVCTYLSCIFGQERFSIFQYKLTNVAFNVTPGLHSSACCTTKRKFLCRMIEQTRTLTAVVQSSVRSLPTSFHPSLHPAALLLPPASPTTVLPQTAHTTHTNKHSSLGVT